MKNIVYLNGHYLPADEAAVSIFDRGFLFGDGVYEVVPVIRGRLVDKAYFLERLGNSLQAINLDWPCSGQEYLDIMKAVVERNQIAEGYVYTQVTRGVAERDFCFPSGVAPTLVAWGSHRAIMDNPLADTGVSVVTLPDLRWKRRDIKSLNLLAQCLAKQAAREQNAFEGWMVEDGLVTEGASSSAYIVKQGRIITRPLSTAILPGIRRRVILELARDQALQLEERAFTVAEAMAADEAFLSSATTLVLPVVRIDGHPVGNGKPGPVTHKMRSLYQQAALLEANGK
ncbi:MAG: hypothetical protein RLZZ385_1765 [Pseudomonadota bacterium]